MTDYPETFEDVAVGDTFDLDGRYEVTREEIIEFAEQYDPQPFHVDEEVAKESMFGGLIASGWHTCAMAMRLMVDGFLTESGAQGAAGTDDLRWHRPVRPGDVLRVEGEVVDKRAWSEDMGLVRSRVEVSADGDGRDGEQLVLSFVALVLWARGD